MSRIYGIIQVNNLFWQILKDILLGGIQMGIEDKAERVLAIFSKLKSGKIVYKTEESVKYGVSPRTIQRDISDIQCFMENQSAETGEVQEIVFDKKAGGYCLQTVTVNHLEAKEILAVCKVLLESRSLLKEELFPIIQKLLNTCNTNEAQKTVKELIGNEMHHYVELRHRKKLLDILWILEEAVRSQRYVKIFYKKMKNQEMVERKVKPVGIMFSEFYFYLTAYIEDIDKEKAFQNPDDSFPTIYRIDRIEKAEVMEEHFAVPYAERFEEGEFRKRVQFMYGGKLQTVKFKYKGLSIESVLDRLPTAEIIESGENEWIVKAEVFGDGVDIWMRGQGEMLEVVN